jgi:anti-sigma regulatory factor (Ser/Thr protein kinase)
MDQHDEICLDPTPQAVGIARRFVLDRCRWGLRADQRDRLVLVVSEIVTNAVRHARSLVHLRVVRRHSTVRVEIHDDASAMPRFREPAPDDLDGRGLHLVEALADEWGVTPSVPRGKTVWAQVHLMPPRPRTSQEGMSRRAAS